MAPPASGVGLDFPLISRWKAALAAAPEFPPAYDATHAYVALRNRQLVAVALDSGKPSWSVECPMTAAPAAGDQLAFAGGAGFVQAHAQRDGAREWISPIDGTVASLYWDTGWLLAVTDRQELLALRARDGGVVWRRALAAPLSAAPAPAGDRLYLALADGSIAALALETGDPVWAIALAGAASAILPLAERIYVGSTDNNFYCLSPVQGAVLWKWKTGADIVGKPALDARRVYFVSLDNVLRALDRTSGSVQWQKPLPMRPSAGPLLTGWTLVVAGVAAELHAFSTELNGAPTGDLVLLTPEKRERQLAAEPHLTPGDLLVLITKGGEMEAFAGSPSPSGP